MLQSFFTSNVKFVVQLSSAFLYHTIVILRPTQDHCWRKVCVILMEREAAVNMRSLNIKFPGCPGVETPFLIMYWTLHSLTKISAWYASEDSGKKMQHQVLNVTGKNDIHQVCIYT